MTTAVPNPAATLPLRAGWAKLPREARDTLFQLCVIGWIILPHLNHLPWWCGALTAVVLFWRGYLAATGGALPGRWTVIGLLVIGTSLTLWTERTLLGKEAGVTLLVLLMGLKTLELRARRDALVVFFLGFFLVLTHCLYSQSLLTALAMAVATWGLLTAQVLASMPVGRPTLRRAGGIAARSALLGLPLMALLFVLFPRISPLWGLPQDGMGHTGLSGTLRLGGVAEVANDDSIAFRVRFNGPPPPSDALYFRGPVLSLFDGLEWRQVPPSGGLARTALELRLAGSGLPYELLLEPIRLPLLPLLEATPDRPDSAPQLAGWGLHLSSDLQWQADRLITDRLRVQAQAWTRFEHGPTELLAGAFDLTRVPSDSNPKALAWARALRAAFHRNPWVLYIPTSAPPMTPNSVAWMERGLACLRDTPLSEGAKIYVLLLVTGFVRNEARLSADLAAAAERTGDATEQSMASWARLLSKVTDAERFPAVTAALAAGELDTPGGPDDEFVFGLERMLDGIEALVRAP